LAISCADHEVEIAIVIEIEELGGSFRSVFER